MSTTPSRPLSAKRKTRLAPSKPLAKSPSGKQTVKVDARAGEGKSPSKKTE